MYIQFEVSCAFVPNFRGNPQPLFLLKDDVLCKLLVHFALLVERPWLNIGGTPILRIAIIQPEYKVLF